MEWLEYKRGVTPKPKKGFVRIYSYAPLVRADLKYRRDCDLPRLHSTEWMSGRDCDFYIDIPMVKD